MRRSSLATALLLLVQTDASCLTWSCSFSGYGTSQSVTSGGITYSYCCSGKMCSSPNDDCTGSAATASPPPPSNDACTDLDNGATSLAGDGCSDIANWIGLGGATAAQKASIEAQLAALGIHVVDVS